MTRDEIIAVIVEKAHEHGIEPYEFLGGAIAESELDPKAFRSGVWPDVSTGLFQQTIAFADEGDQSASAANIAAVRALYERPEYACDVAAPKYLYWRHNPDVPPLTAWVAYNGPSFYHTPEESPNVENYRRALAEAQAILGAAPMPTTAPVYNPDTPTIIQSDEWSCAPTAATWGMTAFGRHPSAEWMKSTMVAEGYESAAQGLLDGSGAGLAAFLTEQYGEYGYSAANSARVSFDDVKSVAGTSPVLLGGHGWGGSGHWTGVRRYDPTTDTLVLANPGGTGPIYGQQSLSRQQFEQIGPVSMVAVTHESQQSPAPDPPADPLPRVRQLLQEALALIGE